MTTVVLRDHLSAADRAPAGSIAPTHAEEGR
mgnify:CR=1 FL=1|jgi:hypothetical protein